MSYNTIGTKPPKRNVRILITGGSGFIGSNLINILIKHGYRRLFVLDVSPPRDAFYFPEVTYINADILDSKALNHIFSRVQPNVLIHLAAIHYIPQCNRQPRKTMTVNVQGTARLIDAANRVRVNHFILASSGAIYGNYYKQISENERAKPIDIYGRSKLLAEQAVIKQAKIPWTICRIFNVYGPGETHPHLIESILQQLYDKQKAQIKLGNIHTKRDYIFVQDVCCAFQKILLNKKAFNEVFNIGYGETASGLQVLQILSCLRGGKIKYVKSQKHTRKHDIAQMHASIEKIQRTIGWSPRISFEKGLQRTLKSRLKNFHVI